MHGRSRWGTLDIRWGETDRNPGNSFSETKSPCLEASTQEDLLEVEDAFRARRGTSCKEPEEHLLSFVYLSAAAVQLSFQPVLPHRLECSQQSFAYYLMKVSI